MNQQHAYLLVVLSKVGDCRWRSADKSRGSVRNYAKDVKDRKKGSRRRVKDQPSEPLQDTKEEALTSVIQKGTSFVRMILVLAHPCRDLCFVCASGDVKTWNSDNVAEWLELLGMGKFQEAFRTNEITGRQFHVHLQKA
jgi:hypothetical protein